MPKGYPKDWHKIADRIGERAGHRCERCGVGEGESYNRHSGRVISQKEFERLGKAATRARKQRLAQQEQALRQARERFLSPYISEAHMSGDFDTGYFAEGGYYPIENQPSAGELVQHSNNNIASRFEVHHIDGNTQNNEDSNLEFLCKRCHIFKTIELAEAVKS
jgi:hypothetical protein